MSYIGKKLECFSSYLILLFSLLCCASAMGATLDNPNFHTINGEEIKERIKFLEDKNKSEHVYAIIETQGYNFSENEVEARISRDITGKNGQVILSKGASLIGKYRFTMVDKEETLLIIWTLTSHNENIIRLAPSDIWEKIKKTKNALILVSSHPYPSEWRDCKNCLERIKEIPINVMKF